jgi:hypothetical protein
MNKTIPEKLAVARKIQGFFTETARASLECVDDETAGLTINQATGDLTFPPIFQATSSAGPVRPKTQVFEDRVFLFSDADPEKAVDGLLHELFLSAQSGLLSRVRGTLSDTKRRGFENALRELENMVVGPTKAVARK